MNGHAVCKLVYSYQYWMPWICFKIPNLLVGGARQMTFCDNLEGFLVEQTGIFVVYFWDLDYLFPVNNRQKFRYELYAHTPHHRSLLLQYIDFQYT